VNLAGQPITAEDYAKLFARWIDRETADRSLFRRVDSREGAAIVGRNGNGNFAGILITYVWPGESHVREYRLRRDYPEIEYDANGLPKERGKYLSPPGRGNLLYLPVGVDPLWLSDASIDLVITEGEFKTVALFRAAWHGLGERANRPRFLPVGLSGVWNWRGTIGKTTNASGARVDIKGVIPDFGRVEWKQRRVTIIFDRDLEANEKVRWARDLLTKELRERGARVHVFQWPAVQEKGIDDYLAVAGPDVVLDLIERAPAHGSRERTDEASSIRSETAADWPKPEPLQSDLPPVETFSEELLPDSFRPLVMDVAERMQVPMDYPAVVLMLSLAGVVNRRAIIQPKANDAGWVIVPNLWGGIIAPPGYLKSPVIQAATRPLHQIQADWRCRHEGELLDYMWRKEEYDLRLAAWKEQYKAASKKGETVPARPEDQPEEPKLRRLIVNDATFEALHKTMSENPAGILVIRDELTGWWSLLDRPGREGERAFCLQAWNGDTGHTIDRIGRGTIHVEACCMSMLGGIQPGRLRSYLVDALEDGPTNDGLIQRFQLLVWPETPPDWKYVDRLPDAASGQKAALAFGRLVEMSAENPARFRFDPDAQQLFIDWLSELEAKIRGDELHAALTAHLGKYRSLMPSLALLFELADLASSVGFDGTSLTATQNLVGLKSTQQAAAFCDYLESHACRIYSAIVTPQLRAARELADHVKKKHIRNRDGGFDWFAARDVYLKCWSGLDSPEAVRIAAEVLEDAGWLRSVPHVSGPLGGRPPNRYMVNPRVWE
jgi:putative DNA primase/helicase